jgi:nitrogen-specific signal transduction histidine kinase
VVFLDINPAFEKQTSLKGARGKLMRQLAPHHELRNPLAPLRSALQLVRLAGGDPRPHRTA